MLLAAQSALRTHRANNILDLAVLYRNMRVNHSDSSSLFVGPQITPAGNGKQGHLQRYGIPGRVHQSGR